MCVGGGAVHILSLRKNSCKDDLALVSWFLGAGEHVPPISKVHMQRKVIGLLYSSHILQYSAFHSARIHILLVRCALCMLENMCNVEYNPSHVYESYLLLNSGTLCCIGDHTLSPR